jgi:hypothetical protein
MPAVARRVELAATGLAAAALLLATPIVAAPAGSTPARATVRHGSRGVPVDSATNVGRIYASSRHAGANGEHHACGRHLYGRPAIHADFATIARRERRAARLARQAQSESAHFEAVAMRQRAPGN